VLEKLASINGDLDTINLLAGEIDNVLKPVEIPESWATIEPEVEKVSLPTEVTVNSFAKFERVDPNPPNELENWTIAAKGLLFKEAYGTKTGLRPDLGIKTGIVHVKERRRLTPLSYDRNIFHIEFDLGNSGLTYAIGEALGIHAENDKIEVEQFIKWYGLDANEIVQVPSRDDPEVLENRTVYQSLVQNVDIFGRPPKKFYEALADFASDEKEKKALLTLSTPDGATEFKRRQEVDTITFADILLEFASAHPSFHDIVRIVSPIKRREYSIASSQKVTPTSVALLIVTVDWVDPKGRDRFGQATRYLDGLPIGAPVTVSIKPSVMKLPTKTTSPIIMAGLGTGLAPFRAFVQERAYQKQQGHDIGAVMLYMGSRHQKEEYLYGEEWEAYRDAGIITHMGCAFSRDQPQKIYIQDRMRQTMEEVRQAYFKEEGSFYLCGPTWPVPDVTEVLQEAFENEEKSKGTTKKIDSLRAIEELKDQGRYVLEVY
jgi:sulfite reductase (NADPH) flavoprotein alpha-component